MNNKILISACLLGYKVRYDGKDNLQSHARLQDWINAGRVVSICPEMAGGLPTPRPPAEIQATKSGVDVLNGHAKVLTNEGMDVTTQYIDGASKTSKLVLEHNIDVAILKARSPSCGFLQIYDGTFSKKIVSGMGTTAALLNQHGVQVFDEDQLDAALDAAENWGIIAS